MSSAHPFLEHVTPHGAPPRFGAEIEARAPAADNVRGAAILAASVALVVMTLSIKVRGH